MKRIITLLQILFLCIFIVCAAVFGKLYYGRIQTEREMEQLKNQTVNTSKNSEISESELQEETNMRADNGMLSKYYDLYTQNNDMVGWVSISGTAVDYPVMYNSESNAYYLHRNFYGENSSSGMIFLDYQCNTKGKCDNMIIYGHNMKNGTMFHTLLNYAKKDFYTEHPTIKFDTLYKEGSYDVFAVFRTSVGSENEFRYYDFINAGSSEEYREFVTQCKQNSLYDTGITPTLGEKLLTLSTCSYSSKNERFVVVAVKR